MKAFKAMIVAVLAGLCVLRPALAVQKQAIQTPAELTFNQLAARCAPTVHASTLQALARTESNFNPYAIGVVGGSVAQPKTLEDAIATVKTLHKAGKNFSMGLAQINKYNLPKFGLSYETVFDPCQNLQTGAQILEDCFNRAGSADGQVALQKALSCYYSGNFRTGFRQDFKGQPPYVKRIQLAAARNSEEQKLRIPAINATAPLQGPVKATVKNKPTAKDNRNPDTGRTVATQAAEKRETASWDAFGDW
ncbi:type IV secretion system protein VirB1 [Advenella incenata]|uniref:Type IV secretion system protein VirB1 n=1 Tax=Advenella incenata TaxID=267800 RepID=A0A4Q7V6L0_9BURK|nr:lytic transglycosylase domain-containing protein [Advenella incenata]RZT91050.1 type IV secretion system protein VirB1 [Advenella incenata]